jgi:hypothetical protein
MITWRDIRVVFIADGLTDDVIRAARYLISQQPLPVAGTNEDRAMCRVLAVIGWYFDETNNVAVEERIRLLKLWTPRPSVVQNWYREFIPDVEAWHREEEPRRLVAAQWVYERATDIKNAKGD